MEILVILAVVIAAGFIVLSKVGKTKAGPQLSLIQMALTDVSKGIDREPTWSKDKLKVTVLFQSLHPLIFEPFDMRVAQEWLEGEGTRRDVLTFAHRAEAAGLTLSQQFEAAYEFTRMLMRVEGGNQPDQATRDAQLFICGILKNNDASCSSDTSAVSVKTFSRLFSLYNATEIEGGDDEILLEMTTTFRGEFVAVIASLVEVKGYTRVLWVPDIEKKQRGT